MKHLDLFSGIGGFALAARNVGWQTVGFCEIDPWCHKVLSKHWPDVPIYDDVKELTSEEVRPVDIITGGFPCQDLSLAGKQAGFDGDRSSLYTEMLRIISECRPQFAVFENVTNLITGESGRWFGQFLYDLAAVGLDAEWHCLRAARVGRPQSRDRVWIVAYPARNDGRKGCLSFPDIKRGTSAQFRRFLGLGRGHREIGRWEVGCQPRMVRNPNGVSSRMDQSRIKGLGNAIVPQVAQVIFEAINESNL